jgi:hypothetical protein
MEREMNCTYLAICFPKSSSGCLQQILAGIYVMRYRVLVVCDVPAHWHPEDEHVTVIAGEVSLGFGETFSADVLRPLTAGSYALIPRRQPHFTRYAAGTIVQVHGVGPLVINYLNH